MSCVLLSWLAAAPAAAEPPQVGPFVLEDGRGNALRLRLLSQWTVEGRWQGEERSTRARLRRFRLFQSGNLLDGGLRYSVQLSFAPRSNELLDLWLEPRIRGDWRFRFGQFKTPFTRYRMASFADLQLVDWSVVTQYFGNERQIGATVHNGYGGGRPFELQLGVFTGTNARRNHGIAAPVLYGQPLPSPSDLSDPFAPFAQLHPEVVAHVGWSSRPMNVRRWDDTEGGPARVHVGASLSHDLRPTYGQDATTRIAGETLLKAQRLSVGAIGYFATFPTHTGGTSSGLLGGLAEVSIRLAEGHALAARAARVEVLNPLQADIAAAIDGEGPLEVEPGLLVIQREDELTVGWKGNLLSDTVQLYVDVIARHQRTSGSDRNSGAVRTQLQTRF